MSTGSVEAALVAVAIACGIASLGAIVSPAVLDTCVTSRSATAGPPERPRAHPTIARQRIGMVMGVGVGLLLPWPVVVFMPLLGAVGWQIPRVFEARTRRRRRREIDAQVPQFLDLLAAASSAGLSGQLALRRSVEAVSGPLADELSRAIGAVDLGARWRDELEKAAHRLGIDDLQRTVAALARTETLGTSLADSTRELADSVRSARRAAVTERARTAPVKMLFPLVFLVLPAFLLLTVVPVLLTTVRSIS